MSASLQHSFWAELLGLELKWRQHQSDANGIGGLENQAERLLERYQQENKNGGPAFEQWARDLTAAELNRMRNLGCVELALPQ
jgi:hypothetical protein